MALALANQRISRDEYLEGELASEIRHEYVAGNVYAMSGGTLNHLTIPTLGTYILAETDSPLLTLHRREGRGFRREILSGLEAVLELPEADINIRLAELYQDVD